MSADDPLERHKDLVAEGWTRRFTVEEPRLSEMAQAYESMGLEVRIESGVPEEGRECQVCLSLQGPHGPYKTIYTRSGGLRPDQGLEDLFD